ncbi:AN1-type zinc finger protein 2A isoform X1 [Haemaphysalis longicornis]
MEFPDLGQHCSENSCKILDFLPLKCDACRNIYCKDHFQYRQHGCSAGVGKDVQVPVCPLCNRPVPSRRGDLPDVAVGDHIDRECQSDPAQAKRKAYVNRCSVKGCKQKEVIPVKCVHCNLNHCLKHRYPDDHRCTGHSSAGAVSRLQQRKPANPPPAVRTQTAASNVLALQGSLSEDEALARALQLSMYEAEDSGSSDRRPHRDRNQRRSERSCLVS